MFTDFRSSPPIEMSFGFDKVTGFDDALQDSLDDALEDSLQREQSKEDRVNRAAVEGMTEPGAHAQPAESTSKNEAGSRDYIVVSIVAVSLIVLCVGCLWCARSRSRRKT